MLHTSGHHSNKVLAALACAAALGVSGCAASSPSEEGTYVIGIQPGSTEQKLLGEMYRVLLTSAGSPAEVKEVDHKGVPAVDVVRSGQANLAIGCTGTLLAQLNPQLAEEAAEEIRDSAAGEDANDDSASENVYEFAVGSFPGGVMTVDPSPAQGCAPEGEAPGEGELPTNVIPVFAKSELNRTQVNRINFVNRVLSTEDLAAMVDDVNSGKNVGDVMEKWLLEHTKVSVDSRSEDEGDSGQSDNLVEQPPV
ncbi:hypothetical protein G7Y29_04110 [Corynebacterium qintianiae]|uniref:ABC-type glycine betaine transport system substrate-binding domain-containing protein n=1 Tax=Corynebacterium qintianiae TaxID=2709392 RepID=A0A7T0KPA7_9CORY|nr:glycine betaine ABC transporter substrate-binding protein [Corynebacterium qintianiae]QPK83979.1 hypothetical protein G7Y29_04110 [Corynebacterium qintianiae]